LTSCSHRCRCPGEVGSRCCHPMVRKNNPAPGRWPK